MNPNSIVAIALIALFVGYQTRKDYGRGVCWAVFFLVWLPHGVRIEMPGAIPELTIHRVILLVVIGFGAIQGRFRNLSARLPLFGLLCGMLISYIVSMFFSIDVGISLKRLFFIVFENYLLYVAIVVGEFNADKVESILKSGLFGVLFVGILSPLEYYKGLNVIGKFLPVGVDNQGVISTYEHSIHFGYVMAMAMPLALVFSGRAVRFHRWLFYLLASGVIVAGCYFSGSRGALLGVILAFILIAGMGGRPIRKIAAVVGLLIALGMVVKPGVRDTVFGMVDSLLIHDGEQDASAEYRKVLWKVAYTKISESPTKWLFGLGGGCTLLLDISEFFERGRGGNVSADGHSSWDSQWAANFVQYGVSGLILEVLIWVKIFWLLGTAWRDGPDSQKKLLILGTVAGCAVYVWAMLTVAMFSPQLKYLVSTLIGCGMLLLRQAQPSRDSGEAPVSAGWGPEEPEIHFQERMKLIDGEIQRH